MEQLFSELRAEMKRLQAVLSEQTNKSWRVSILLEVRDIVWLDPWQILIIRSSMNLVWKCIAPYEMIEVISPCDHQIKYPKQTCIHHVQPISWLVQAAQYSLPYQTQWPPPVVILEVVDKDNAEWVDISTLFWRQLQYPMKWTGYDECSWEPVVILDGLKAID
jgi:hypothetical protein